MCQQGNKITEGINKRLNSLLLNIKLVGGYMHPEELQAKKKVINTSRSDEDTTVTVE